MCVVQNLFRRKPAARPMRHRDSKDTRCFPGDEYGQRTTQTIYRRHRGGRRGLNGARPGAEPGRRRIFFRSGRLTAAGRGRGRAHRARQVARAGQRQGFRRGRRWRRRRSRRDPGRDRSAALARRRPFVSAGRYLQRRRDARSVRDRSPLDRWLRPGQHDHPHDLGDRTDFLLRRRPQISQVQQFHPGQHRRQDRWRSFSPCWRSGGRYFRVSSSAAGSTHFACAASRSARFRVARSSIHRARARPCR